MESFSQLLSEWSSRNNKRLDEFSHGSHFKAWWKCNKGHEWQTQIRLRFRGHGCPVCSGTKVLSGENDLATLYPQLVKEWDHDKNTIDPSLIRPGTFQKAWWKCSKGHSWQTSVVDRVRKTNCPFCSGKKAWPGENDLATLYPQLAKEWDYDKNIVAPSSVRPGSKEKVWWKCNKGHEWQSVIAVRTRRDGLCPFCSKNKSESVNLKNYPDILIEWDYEKNTDHDLENITLNTIVWWKCKQEHTSQISIKDKIGGKKCFYCEGTKVFSGYNDLFTLFPDLKNEWDYSKNTIDPEQTFKASAKMAWWKCDKGHSWEAVIYSRTSNNPCGCPNCAKSLSISKGEKMIADYIKSLGFQIETNKADIPNVSEVDIYVPEKQLAIEYNGLYWHTQAQGKHIRYHYNKWLECKKQGIQLLQVWEDDWEYKQDIVKNMIAHKLGVNKQSRVYARKTIVKDLDKDTAYEFLDSNHIQGYGKGSIRLGLFDKQTNNLVAVSIFKQRNETEVELVRYATNQQVIGGMGKLIKHVKKNYEYKNMVTFADHCVSNGGLYEKLGFVNVKQLKPDYSYLVNKKRVHKFNYRLKRFKNDPDLLWDETLSETGLAKLNNIDRIWDAGKTKYELKLK